MHFLDAWVTLSPLHALRLAVPALLLLVGVFVPGRQVARLTALGVALALPFLPELGMPPSLTLGWMLLWLAVAWPAGQPSPRAGRSGVPLGGLESGSIGLLLGAALLVLLVACVARLDLAADSTRRVSLGLLLVCLGLLHLMVRRHALRAGVAFAGMGLGLQALDGALRQVLMTGDAPPQSLPLLAAGLAAALAVRVGNARAATTGSAWVSDAHDLHD